jgi:predicted PhzF superfamily epimerase YddE/YHI9
MGFGRKKKLTICGLEVTGLYPFKLRPRNPNAIAEARQFPYGGGVPEDPVTGVAAYALGAYLVCRGVVSGQEPTYPSHY